MQEQAITKADLTALNRLTLKELKEEDVFIFTVTMIDDQPTSNGRVWSKDFQENAVNKGLFVGIPVVVNHENDQTLVLGRVYHASIKQNAVIGNIYVPLDTPIGKEAKSKIESGLFKSVSINARAENTKKEGDLLLILPSDTDRIFELSFVAVPGCKSCVVTEQTSGGACESTDESIEQTNMLGKDEAMLKVFASEQLKELQNEFVRLAGFTLDTSKRDLYRKVSESLDPLTLREVVKDFRQSYAKAQNESPSIEVEQGSIESIKRSLQNINKVKGV